MATRCKVSGAIACAVALAWSAPAAPAAPQWFVQYAAYGVPLSAVPAELSTAMRAEGYDEVEPCWLFCPGAQTPHTVERRAQGAFVAFLPAHRPGGAALWLHTALGTTTGYDGSATLRLRTAADVWGALGVRRVDAWRGAWIGGGVAAVRVRVWDEYAAPVVLLDVWKPGLVLAAGGEQRLVWSLLTTVNAQLVVAGGSELPALTRGVDAPRQMLPPTRLHFVHAVLAAGLGMRW